MEKNIQCLSDLHVLIIDDSKTSSMLIRQQLVSLGYQFDQVMTAASYQEAVKAVEIRHYDILIMDYHLEQSITGYELITLLLNKRLIDKSTGVLIVSGDSRQETVLTSLSGRVKHFIMKPIKTVDLKNKLQILQHETSALYQIQELIKLNPTGLSDTLTEYSKELNFAISFESSLIEILVELEMWDTLNSLIISSLSSSHPSKECAKAMLLARNGHTLMAIKALSDYLVQNPLSLKAMDYLSSLYEMEHNKEEALYWALKAFEFTPSVSERAIRAATLAADLNKRSVVIRVGYTFANHISIVDSRWLQSIIKFGHSLEAVYIRAEEPSSKKELLQHFNNFLQMTEKRLPKVRKPHLVSYRSVFQCRLLFHENKLEGSHKKILQSISSYYDNLSTCPIALTCEILPILELFGELWLHDYLSKLFASQLKRYELTSSDLLKQAPFDVKHLKELYDVLPNGGSRETDEETIAIYEMIINLFPYSTEAKIRYLHAVASGAKEPTHNPILLLTTLSDLALPPNWNQWLTDLRNANTSIEPPAPFSVAL
ncbi:response regulator [Vibrio makurazakiensis]|uniref:response regulator n=1 Tax=Vibrio makurazakiensis TaxID=2910250 RepID=UPI003D0FA593